MNTNNMEPKQSFVGETEYICRSICMCNQFGRACTLQPHDCKKALDKIAKLTDRLVLGNNPSTRMTFLEMRVAKDYFFIVQQQHNK